MIEVRLFATFRDIVNSKLEYGVDEVDSVGSLLSKLVDEYPEMEDQLFENNELRDNIMILINGKNIEFLKKLDTELEKGDRVAIFPPIAGG
ncbi:ubiquitin-like small modifier protein 1 [Methanonatronarchaeum sp. AMET-Sl]|uniref:ubiquitin-like small modifier protein 1 n=1 Tax=Methanonatronarchaeum sp. AMET-Sl TaxID=3037654 RepID=UPI00244E55EC|nr:ubiquitin-like small modifier protein 1 [Methanonatronarchaeum sp. AMET-Sl]WGI17204.1 MoaD/ThiS family protein [Methanonatronarchaeum sp. AMET-Sl]